MDTVTKEQRSVIMSRIRGKNTKPEMIVRRAAHSLGLRFRLHRKDLPGSPDLVFVRRRKAMFVHGCFWHRHECRKAYTPKSNADFWQQKFARNVERDAAAQAKLRAAGWDPVIVWECEVSAADLPDRLKHLVADAA